MYVNIVYIKYSYRKETTPWRLQAKLLFKRQINIQDLIHCQDGALEQTTWPSKGIVFTM